MTEETEQPETDESGGLSVDTDFSVSKVVVGSDEEPVTLDQDLTRIGSNAGNDIELSGDHVGGFHCEIWRQRDHYVLVNRGTNHETLVNGQPVEFRLLRPGDDIEVGDVRIHVQGGRDGDEPDQITPEHVEDLFENDEEQETTPRRRTHLSDTPSPSSSGHRRRGGSSTRRARASGGQRGMLVNIILALAGIIVVLLSLWHFLGLG